MKKIYLLSLLLMTTIFAWSQQNTLVLQPDRITCQQMVYDNGVYNPYNSETTFQYNEDGTFYQILNSCNSPDYWGYHFGDFEYDNHNNIIGYNYTSFFAASGSLSYDIIYSGGNIIEIEKTYHNLHGNDWSIRKKAYFDGSNRIVEDSIIHDNGDGTITLTCHDIYEYNDNEIVMTQYSLYEPTTLRITTTLAADGNALSVKHEEMTDGVFVNTEYAGYHYENGFLASVETSHWDGEWVPYSKDTYSRNSEGAVIMAEHKLWNGVEYANDKRTMYEYNEAGYPISIHFQDYSDTENTWVDGISLIENRYTYFTSPDWVADRLFTQEHLQFLDVNLRNGIRYFGRMDITYTETANPYYDIEETEDMPVTVHPNPTNNIVTITGKDIAKVEVANILGQSVISKERSGDIIIDLSQQPSGIYIFNITDLKGNRCSRKVLKTQL